MPKGTCAVTGATGFLGHHLARRMKESGWSVKKMQRRRAQEDEAGDGMTYFSMGEDLNPEALADVNLLIHCAYDFSCRDWNEIKKINIDGTGYLFEAAKRAEVGQIVFISSMHAFEGCRTMYGRAKLAGEKCAFDQGGIVIRPGTIYVERDDKLYGGQGGGTLQFFEKLFRMTPVIPLLYSKEPTIYTSYIHDLLDLIEEAVSMDRVLDKPICAVNERPLRLKQFLTKIKDRQVKRKVLFIPVPWRIPWLFLALLERMKFNLPFRSESILTFFDQNPQPDFSPLEYFKTGMRSFS
jgi:nucleoside-diphosphate-sugar epimerase